MPNRAGAEVLVAGDNFCCGSPRGHGGTRPALIVADTHPALPGLVAILRVDPATGDRNYVSR